MKIALVGAFNLAEGYLGAAKALEKQGNNVVFIPAFKYRSENPQEHTNMIIRDLQNNNADVILWWRGETLSGIEFQKVRKNCEGKFVMFSWDDPLQWERHLEMPFKSQQLDFAFSCCMDSVEKYKENGCEASFYCPPGFDPEIHYPEESEDHKCDISIVCTNLYEGTEITKRYHISRKQLLSAIIDEFKDLKIHIYGPENFKNIFPDQYRGWVQFEESRKVFRGSKINICTHIRPDGSMYINERVCQILGSGGLLFVDQVKDMDKVLDLKKECIVMDIGSKKKLVSQIKEILDDPGKIEEIRENGRKKALEKLTWDSWAETLLKNIN